jgi:glycosyltransferase involved in cell wall biosynthesis
VTIAGGDGVATDRLAHLVREARPDVLQVGPLPLAARLAGSVPAELPVVVVSYGWDVQQAENDGWADVEHALARADGAICDCAAIEDALRSRCGPGVPIARFPWGVDLALFTPDGPSADLRSAHAWPATDAVLLATRRLEPLYDPLTLVEAVGVARSAHRLRLLFVGEGSLQDEIATRAAALGIGERIAWHPPVPESRVPELMRGADIWVNAARADGASISLLQSLACGTPVVTPDLTCAREWADEAVGALFPAGDAGAAAAAIDDVLARGAGLAGECRRRAEARADWRVHARTYSSLVLDAVPGAAAHGRR